MPRKPRIVVTGFVGLFPYGGVAWDYVQYVVGLAALGWDALYLEDTGAWPVYQHGKLDCTVNVAHVASTMQYFGQGERWAYRDALSGRCFGLSEASLQEFCRTADIFLNLSCSAMLREEYAAIPVRALVDTDPMFTQIQYLNGTSLTGGPTGMRALIENHTHRFTLGANIGSPDCRIPTLGMQWHPTVPPVVLDLWPQTDPPTGGSHDYSTVMNWSVVPDVTFAGERWGQKDVEFARFLQLPKRVPAIPLGLAVSQTPDAPFPLTAAREIFRASVAKPAAFGRDVAVLCHAKLRLRLLNEALIDPRIARQFVGVAYDPTRFSQSIARTGSAPEGNVQSRGDLRRQIEIGRERERLHAVRAAFVFERGIAFPLHHRGEAAVARTGCDGPSVQHNRLPGGLPRKSVGWNRTLHRPDVFSERHKRIVPEGRPHGGRIDEVANLREGRIRIDQHTHRHLQQPIPQNVHSRNVQANVGRPA
jgi:hypothetical protein